VKDETEIVGSYDNTATSFGLRFDFGPNSGTTFRLRDIPDFIRSGVLV
jgi:hypothetical protein